MCDDFERFVVIIPTSFTMNEAEYEEYVRRIEAVSLRVVIQLNKYMKLVGTSDYLATDMEADEQMAGYISDTSVTRFQPMNVNFGIMEPLGFRVRGKANKNMAIAERSLQEIEGFRI